VDEGHLAVADVLPAADPAVSPDPENWDLGSGPNFVKWPALAMAFYIRDDLTTV
jgi:hypothetical protein